jgi:hypothetical protein
MKNRFKWIEKNGYLIADQCKYLLRVYRTSRGLRADLIDWKFFTIKGNLSINYAKKLARDMS